MSFDFGEIQQQLRERGMSSYRQQPYQLVVSRQRGPAWPNRGNSFWICRLHDDWYVCTWSPYYYRIPAESSVLDVCEAFVDVGTSAQYRVPPELIERFGLIEVDHGTFDSLLPDDQPSE